MESFGCCLERCAEVMEAKRAPARAEATASNAVRFSSAALVATEITALEALLPATAAPTACCTDPTKATPHTVCHAHINLPSFRAYSPSIQRLTSPSPPPPPFHPSRPNHSSPDPPSMPSPDPLPSSRSCSSRNSCRFPSLPGIAGSSFSSPPPPLRGRRSFPALVGAKTVGVDVQVTCLVMEGGGAMDATEGETHSTSRHISGGELTRGFRSRETSPRRDAPSAVALKAALPPALPTALTHVAAFWTSTWRVIFGHSAYTARPKVPRTLWGSQFSNPRPSSLWELLARTRDGREVTRHTQ
mmetsp:Transcript_1820/g.6181  ORF Transcript_1820/g.6181 Transcript_1820/m.6181 type:complete len:301 (-) Transcript_1820:2810-3712(-)